MPSPSPRRPARRPLSLPPIAGADRHIAAQWHRLQRQHRSHHRTMRLARIGAALGFTLATVGLIAAARAIRNQPAPSWLPAARSAEPIPLCVPLQP